MANFELRVSGQGNFATTLDDDATGIRYIAAAGADVINVDSLTGAVVALKPGSALFQAIKDDIVIDEHHIVVLGNAQFAYNVARQQGTVKVKTIVTVNPNDVTPPVVLAPYLGHEAGILSVDWTPPVDTESLYQLALDVRSLDNVVVLAAFLPVTNQGRPYEFPVADTRTYRVTLRATNAVGLQASAFTDIIAGQNDLTGVTMNVAGFPDVIVSWDSQQNGERSYVVTFYDENDQIVYTETVLSGPGTAHTQQFDLTGVPSGTLYVRVYDAGYTDTNPPSAPIVVAQPNAVANPDGGDNGDGTVTLTWTNEANEQRDYTILIFNEGGSQVYQTSYTGTGTSQMLTIDLEVLGLPPGGYSFAVIDADTGASVISADFIYGGTIAGGEPDVLLPNAATPAAATSTAADPLRPASNAFDGNEATYFQSAGAAETAAIGQAFGVGNEVEIGSVILVQDYANGYYATGAKVQCSADGVNWIDATPDTAFNGPIISFTEITPVGVQSYWQVVFTGANPELKPIRITELNMYPYAVPSEGYGDTPYGTGPYGY